MFLKKALALCLCVLMTAGAAGAETRTVYEFMGKPWVTYHFSEAEMLAFLDARGLLDVIRWPAAYPEGKLFPSGIAVSFPQQEDPDAWPEEFPDMYVHFEETDGDRYFTFAISVGKPLRAPESPPASTWTRLDNGLRVSLGTSRSADGEFSTANVCAMDEADAALLDSEDAPPEGVLMYELRGWNGAQMTDMRAIAETM